MCKYCDNIFDENKELVALWFKRKGPLFKNKIDMWKNANKKQLGVISRMRSNCKYLDEEAILSIEGKNKKDYTDWLDLSINYCPICGKKLREKLINEEDING